MKIAQVNLGLLPIPPNGWGAVEKIIWNYALKLRELGHEVEIPYLNEIKKNQYDLVHVHVWNHALELYKMGIPYIYTCHDHHVYLAGKESTIYQQNLLAMKCAELSIVPAKYLIEYFENIPIYLEHGVELSEFKLNSNNIKPKLLCVGNNGLLGDQTFDRKGFRYAIESAKNLELDITVVGPTNVNKKFFEQNNDLLGDNVTVLYDLTDDELAKIYSEHDILIHATSIEAGHPPLTILEAAASGLPVITTDCSGDLYTIRTERNTNNVSWVINEVIENLPLYRDKTLNSVKQFDWKNVVNKLELLYKDVTNIDMRKSILNVYNSTKKKINDNKIDISFINGPLVNIAGQINKKYEISFIDNDENTIPYSPSLYTNSWAKANKQRFTNWTVRIVDEHGGETNHKMELKGKNVLIAFDSKSVGDTIAWIPYVEEFRKKHECNVFVYTFHNSLFQEVYPNLTFIDDIKNIRDIYAGYKIGWYYDMKNGYNGDFHKISPQNMPLQQTATDILGLDYVEIKPKIKNVPTHTSETPYICIAIHSTAQTKYWNNPNGWQQLVDYVKSKGYDVYLISNEEDGYMGNKHPDGVISIGNKSLEDTSSILKGSNGFVGISSGLSWLSWALGVPTILISGFTETFQEMKSDVVRIINEDVCHGCFAKDLFDKSDWNWCPEHKGTSRQFECSKSITFDMVKPHVEKLLKL